MYKKILITGGAGFIGSHFVRYVLGKYSKTSIVNVDLLTYCGNLENLRDVEKNPRYVFHKADIGDFSRMKEILKQYAIECVVNFAAESDNNKAIAVPIDFAKTNVLGVATLLEAAHEVGVKRFHHVSTCEVFGPLPLFSREKFLEISPYRPRTPYNASKAGGDLIALSYFKTFDFPITISYAANNYGSHQFPEKVIPVFAIKALIGEKLPVFKSSRNKREWIHVLDHCRALGVILEKGAIGETYNIGTGEEKTISALADDILTTLEKPKSMISIVPDRPGHDSRYLLDSRKMRKLGWAPQVSWEDCLADTLYWYRDHRSWWEPLLERSHSWKI